MFWIAFDGGSYAATARGALAIAVWWVLAVAVSLSLWPRAPVPAAALVTGGLLTAFVVWIGLSTLWDESAERTVTELNRATLYLGVFALAVCAVDRVRLTPAITGLAAGLTAIGLLALASRLFPDLVDASGQLAQIFPAAEKRLSYPVNYWNGLATLTAFALPLLLYLATSVRPPALRGLALAPLPALVGTIYLTSSRGGSVAAAVAVATFLVCAGRRWAAAAAVGLAGAAAAVVVVVLAARPELVDSPIGSALAADQGRSAALLMAITCLAAGGIWALGSLFAPAPPKLPAAARIALVLVLVALLGVGVAAANPRERFDRFKEIPPGLGEASVQEHLLSGSGNGRWQLWEAAYDEFKRHPLEGRGAGTYEATWSEHGTLPLFVRDAHSLYFEILAELGLVGLLLLVGALVAGSAAAVSRMLKTSGDDRSALAALSAVVTAFAFEAAVDWMWELTAAAVVAFAALGLLVGPATALVAGRTPARATFLRAAAFAAAFAILLAQSVSLLADLRVRESRAAAERADYPEAVSDAQAARSLAPWSASPRLQLALVQEVAGDLDAALESVQEAAARDPIDWRIWLVAARIETKAGDFRGAAESLRRAEELNPRSELFTSE
ncbi:MAG: O-antigen ligase family protein [Gaiellales bacterium]